MGKQPKKGTSRNKKKDISKFKGFFAFPSQLEDRVKIIDNAISKINKESERLHVSGWKDMEKSSSRIITNILDAIQKSDFFVADISGLNPNVLFEAGFAFANRKPTLLVSQGFSSKEFHQDLNDLQILSGWDISRYENVMQLYSDIVNKNPSSKNYVPEFDKYLNLCEQQQFSNRGLFLKGTCKHEIAVSALSFFKSSFDTIIDDWDENKSQPLHWYIKSICQSTTVISLFTPNEWDNSRAMNARFSFICGMAQALNKHVRLIGLPGYITPVDYKEIILRPTNDENVRLLLEADLSPVRNDNIPTDIQVQKQINVPTLNKDYKEIVFLEINIGDSIAENEEHELDNYFIPTGQYAEAINRRQAIIVGNKGTGKTAMFYQLRSHFQRDVRNLICEIKPSDYKLTRFLQAISRLKDGRLEHVLESIWKLVIYCELILATYKKILRKPAQAHCSNIEQDIIAFYNQHEDLIIAPFEQKLDIATDWLEEVAHDSDNFSKKIHDSFLISCKTKLATSLKDVNKIVILVDNLDKSWKVDSNLDQQAYLVLALLGIHRRVTSDLGKVSNVSIIIFLRRNIFEYILESKITREADKIMADHIELQWNDAALLLKIIETRFHRAIEHLELTDDSSNIWNEFFVKNINGTPIKEWIYSKVLPRPRDLIHFIQKSIGNAVNRDHDRIEETDLLTASETYPGFAHEQILSEYKAEKPWLQAAVSSLVGQPDIWNFSSLMSHLEIFLKHIQLDETGVRGVITDLIRIGFMGIQFEDNKIQYADTVSNSIKLRTVIMNRPIDQPLNLVIHPVFYTHLNILKTQNGFNQIPHSTSNDFDDHLQSTSAIIETPAPVKKTLVVMIKELWKDPVWSKVIATGIIALIGILITYANKLL